jgi:hypothetical protein
MVWQAINTAPAIPSRNPGSPVESAPASHKPGAVNRFHIGLVLASGLGIGTLFTLFVVPAVYLLMARDHGGANSEAAAGNSLLVGSSDSPVQ